MNSTSRLTLKTLYFSLPSSLLWLSRLVYMGIIASVLLLHSSFLGEYSLLYSVHPNLLGAAVLGLVAFEIGVALGWRRRRSKDATKTSHIDWLRTTSWVVPFFLWLMGVVGAIILFYIVGIPLLEAPLLRALMGYETGVWKRLAYAFMPMACVEIIALKMDRKCPPLLANTILAITLVILTMFTKKGPILLTILFVLVINWKKRQSYKVDSIEGEKKKPRSMSIYLKVILYAILAWALISFSFTSDIYGVGEMLIIRSTNLIAQSPNYILHGHSGVPDRDKLIISELNSIGSIIRISEPNEPVDTLLTRSTLKRDVEHGGLNPTVIGYGWIIGGMLGIALFSMFYGLLSSKLYRTSLNSRDPCGVVCSLFGFYAVYIALQVFSPIAAFLDLGLSIILYIILHRFIEEITGEKAVPQNRTSPAIVPSTVSPFSQALNRDSTSGEKRITNA